MSSGQLWTFLSPRGDAADDGVGGLDVCGTAGDGGGGADGADDRGPQHHGDGERVRDGGLQREGESGRDGV